jgi:hypothetical protein
MKLDEAKEVLIEMQKYYNVKQRSVLNKEITYDQALTFAIELIERLEKYRIKRQVKNDQ